MADYSILYTDISTRQILGQLPVSGFQFSKILNSPGGFSAVLPLDPDVASVDVPMSYKESILADEPIAFYPLDDSSSVMEDISGNARHGSHYGDATQASGPVSSRIPLSHTYDGLGDYSKVEGDIAEPLRFEGRTEFSVEFWVKLNTHTNFRRFVSTDNNANGWYFLTDSSQKLRMYRAVGSAFISITHPTTIVLGEWMHVVGTYDTNQLKLYVDGTSAATPVADTRALTATTHSLNVATSVPAASHTACNVAALSIYDRVLTDTEITNHYSLGTGALIETTAGSAVDILSVETLAPAKTGIFVERDGVIVWGGMLWTMALDVSANTATIGAEGFMSYFRRRHIRTNLSHSAIDQGNIAALLISHAQAQGGGDIGVTTPYHAHGVTRDRNYLATERKNIGEAIEDLAAVQNGFDFYFTHARVDDTIISTFRTTYPATGRITDLVFELGKNVDLLNYAIDGTTVTTLVDSIGSGNDDEALIVTSTYGSTAYPLLEQVDTYSDIRETETLAKHGNRALDRGKVPIVSAELSVYANGDPGFGSYEVGDVVRVKGSYGLLNINALQRITEMSVTVDSTGMEEVKVATVPKEVFG